MQASIFTPFVLSKRLRYSWSHHDVFLNFKLYFYKATVYIRFKYLKMIVLLNFELYLQGSSDSIANWTSLNFIYKHIKAKLIFIDYQVS